MMAQRAEHAPVITPKMVDWLLYNMPVLREQLEAMEPRLTASMVVLGGRRSTRGHGSQVENVAIKRAAMSAVLDAVDRGLMALHPEQRKVYRMRYRAHMSYKQIGRRMYISEETVGRRLAEIRSVVGRFLQQVNPSDLAEFARFFRQCS